MTLLPFLKKAGQRAAVLRNTWHNIGVVVSPVQWRVLMIYSLRWICIQDCSSAGEQITSLEISTCGDVPVSVEPQNKRREGEETPEKPSEEERWRRSHLLMLLTACLQSSWLVFKPLFDFCLSHIPFNEKCVSLGQSLFPPPTDLACWPRPVESVGF